MEIFNLLNCLFFIIITREHLTKNFDFKLLRNVQNDNTDATAKWDHLETRKICPSYRISHVIKRLLYLE